MKIGIFGGTFNPIHNGHLLVAREIYQAGELDQIWFMPACLPPHKNLAAQVSFADRLAMVRAAIEPCPEFVACDLEGRRGGRSFSVKTLQELRQLYPADEFTFIMGLDSFAEIGLWRSYEQLFDLCHILVAARPGFAGDLQELLPVAMADRFCYDADALKLCGKSGFSVQLVRQTAADISSTEIRNRIAAGQLVDEWICPAVATYIHQHKLYRHSPAG
ncbi:nicotinate-nucleotide adenylyltransferase [Geopsychrobacter electrodiphilus]|uniref:nicotinate-nucleotide adenylyltransferase n=1 Tax=Geopsychrobacter electrodiphilus TaxID=225196 RepID=UPI0003640548|nr:nicotinate-nucleotide adenylyltransferase [Geopsychrobacter electrodiphilus]